MFAQLRGSFDEGMDALGEQTRLVQSMQLQGEAAVLSEVCHYIILSVCLYVCV